MTFLLRFIPWIGPGIAWLAARIGYVLAFAGGVAATGVVVGLVSLPLAKSRAYSAGHAAGMTQASIDHAAAISRARDAHDDRAARQIEDRINAENNARRPAADGVRDCGPAVVDCPAGTPR